MTTAPKVVRLGTIATREQCDDVLRLLYGHLRHRPPTGEELSAWEREACPFPSLRHEAAVTCLLEITARRLVSFGLLNGHVGIVPAEPQFIWHWPQDRGWGMPPHHVDQPPPWARPGQGYAAIAGVALAAWTARNGTLRYHRDEAHPHDPVKLRRGEGIYLRPDVPHHSGLNHAGTPRVGLYFRFLEP